MKEEKIFTSRNFLKKIIRLLNYAFTHLNKESIEQYQFEERTMITFRLASSRYRIKELLDIMTKDEISTPQKVTQLKTELGEYLHNTVFKKCHSMGEVVKTQLKQTLQKNLMLVQKNLGKTHD